MAALLPFAQLAAGAFGIAGMSLGANPVTSLIDGLGLWGLRFLLATLALTPLRFLTGSPRWLLYRRMFGLYAFFYLLLHATAYVVVDRMLDIGFLIEDVLKRTWITLGFAGLVLLVPLAFTSTQGWMRRLGRRWQRLHYLVYPAAILGAWHFWWQVKRDISTPLVYAAVLALLLGWRLVRAYQRRSRLAASASTEPAHA